MSNGVCKKCGNMTNYNFAINNGLCDCCIELLIEQQAEQIKELQAENQRLKEEVNDLNDHVDMITAEDDTINAIVSGKDAEIERLRNLLEDVVNELDLSDSALEEHGPNGTPPAELTKLVLAEKDRVIRMLECGMYKVAQPQKGQDNE